MPQPIPNEPAKPEALSWPQIYLMLDARARDQRQILIAMLAGTIAFTIAALKALGDNDQSLAGWFVLCLMGMGAVSIERFVQIRRTIARGQQVREKLLNRDDVPPIDVNLPLLSRKPQTLQIKPMGDDTQ